MADSNLTKLRAACDGCFAAKVRCSGEQTGCDRCHDVRAQCSYSESRAGKRRRSGYESVDSSIGSSIETGGGLVSSNAPSPRMGQSRPPTISPELNKNRLSLPSNWMAFTLSEPQEDASYFSTGNSPYIGPVDTARSTSGLGQLQGFGKDRPGSAMNNSHSSNSDFLVGESAETNRSRRRSPSIFRGMDSPQIMTPPLRSTSTQPTEILRDEDISMSCIKLLSHLKRSVASPGKSYPDIVDLIRKSNAASRKIVRNLGGKPDYGCVLLLSNIMMEIVLLCGIACRQDTAEPSSFNFVLPDGTDGSQPERQSSYSDLLFMVGGTNRDSSVKEVVEDALRLCIELGSLLKRKPHDGFQVLGRHEMLHVELQQNLDKLLKGH